MSSARTSSAGARSEEPFAEGLLLGVLGIALVLAAGVWAWGWLGGTLFGSGPPRVGAGSLASVLVRLPDRLGDPAKAWPGSVRAQLPGPVGMYGALVLLTAAAGAAITVLARVGALDALRALGSEGGGARWARTGELRPLHRRHETGRLALGRAHGRLLHAEARHALVAFGPPQSGKSAGLAIPALLEWHGPAIASSIKADLLDATVARRRELGDVLVFDPFGLGGAEAHTWSPLRGAGTWDGALEVAWRLAAAGELDQRSVDGGDFWAVAAEQRLAPILFAAARAGEPIERVVRWIYGQGGRELEHTLERLGESARTTAQAADVRAAYDAVQAFERQADRTRSSIEATAQGLMRAYRFTRVARSAAGREITPERLLGGENSLYLIGDAKASKLLRPLFLALLGELVDAAYSLAGEHGGRLPRPLLLCLDEAGNVAPVPNLGEIASTAPSHNIQIISIFHDLAQARARYGGQAETIVNAHRARMLLPGVADLETLRYFSGLVGDADRRDQSRTSGAGGGTRSIGTRRLPLIAPEQLRQLRDGEALLLYGRLPPVIVRLRRWFEHRGLRRLAAGSAGRPEGSGDG